MKKVKMQKTQLKVNTSYVGETIETKVARIITAKEPITDGAPIIYTERKAGVAPEHDIRTQRMDIAMEARNTVAKTMIARRENKNKPDLKAVKGEEGRTDEAGSIEATKE